MSELVTGAPRLRAPFLTTRRLARVAGLCVGIAGSAGCERKAPGPEECVQFAEAWLHDALPRARRPAGAEFEELVVRCLTEPYDRELVSCVTEGSPRERCRVDFVRRLEARSEERFR